MKRRTLLAAGAAGVAAAATVPPTPAFAVDQTDWFYIGHANNVVALAASPNDGYLYAADRNNVLWRRDGTNWTELPWTNIGSANNIVAMTADQGQFLELYAADSRNVWNRPADGVYRPWTNPIPANNLTGLATDPYGNFWATDRYNTLWFRGRDGTQWLAIDAAVNVVDLTLYNGYLYAADSNNRLWTRPAVNEPVGNWIDIGHANNVVGLAQLGGYLYAADSNNGLWVNRNRRT